MGTIVHDQRSYHAERARIERDLAYKATDERVADAHMHLAALHLSRATANEDRAVEARKADTPFDPTTLKLF